jgi:LuxR family transcriptional regulator, maltose regulon positive regulatory protein
MRAPSAIRDTQRRVGLPPLELHVLDRPRLVRRMAALARVSLVIAPAGYGKSVATHQWVNRDGRDVAWLALDLLDEDPAAFWHDVIGAIRFLCPATDDEPDRLLDEFGARVPHFLLSLLRQVERDPQPGVLVLDGISRVVDRAVLEGIELLVERMSTHIQLVMVGRSEPHLPIARWRSLGWLCEIGEEQLRFTDIEAIAAAEALSGLRLPTETVLALSRRTEGWPAGLQLALLTICDDANPEAAAARVGGSGRLLSAYFVAEVLEQLPSDELDVALALSVLDEFDAETCAALLGDEAVPVARALQRRRLFLSETGDGRGTMRFHAIFLEVLRNELLWRDPARRLDLHRRAAELCKGRGDLNGAHHHLSLILDHAGSADLVVAPAFAMATVGDHRGISQMMRSLPSDMRVDSADLAYDLATGWIMAGELVESETWCDRGDQLADPDDSFQSARSRILRCGLAMLSCDLDSALRHIEAFRRFARVCGYRSEFDHFAELAARVFLALRRPNDAAEWIDRLHSIARPGDWTDVTVPMAEAWAAWVDGDLLRASNLAEDAVAQAFAGHGPHSQSAFDAMIIASACRLGKGDLAGAEELSDAVAQDARVLGTPWNRLRAGLLQAGVRRLVRGPRAALDVVAETRRTPGIDDRHSFVRRELDFVEAAALIELGAVAPATRLLDAHPDQPRKRLLLARAASRYETVTTVEETLGLRTGWTLPAQLEADLLIARAGSSTDGALLTETLATANATGWVKPFLGHGQAVEDFITGQPLDHLHPKLLATLSLRRAGAVPTGLRAQLTPRELTVLRLLSTHLSYAEIAGRLYLSVNTVKTNLKSLYRKLDVASRSEAVERATRAGIT